MTSHLIPKKEKKRYPVEQKQRLWILQTPALVSASVTMKKECGFIQVCINCTVYGGQSAWIHSTQVTLFHCNQYQRGLQNISNQPLNTYNIYLFYFLTSQSTLSLAVSFSKETIKSMKLYS